MSKKTNEIMVHTARKHYRYRKPKTACYELFDIVCSKNAALENNAAERDLMLAK